MSEANQLPSPFDTLEAITSKFISKGLDIKDMVVLSGFAPFPYQFYQFSSFYSLVTQNNWNIWCFVALTILVLFLNIDAFWQI